MIIFVRLICHSLENITIDKVYHVAAIFYGQASYFYTSVRLKEWRIIFLSRFMLNVSFQTCMYLHSLHIGKLYFLHQCNIVFVTRVAFLLNIYIQNEHNYIGVDTTYKH